MEGHVKNLIEPGWGLIESGNEPDILFHAQSLIEIAYSDLRPGEALTFDVEISRRPQINGIVRRYGRRLDLYGEQIIIAP